MDETDPLIEAIRAQRAAEFSREVLAGNCAGDPAKAQAVKYACSAISSQMREARSALCVALRSEGIESNEVRGPEDTDELQYHLTTVSVPACDVAHAFTVAETQGFRLPFHPSAAQLAAIAHYLPQMMLVREDEETTRVRIVLTNQNRRLPDKLRPTLVDIATANADTPARYYPILRVLRAVREKMLRRRDARSDSDFIGTPIDLIKPILDTLGTGRTDTVLDLGCGDGRVLFTAASQFECNAIGVESNPELVSEARQKLGSLDPDIRHRIRIDQGFAEDANLADVTIIFLFLPGYLFSKIFHDVFERAEPGTRIVAHEQAPLTGLVPPDSSVPVVGPAAITVANIWTKRPL